MATIYTRAGKGSALTWTEGDANITNLNNELVAKVASVSAGTGISVGGTSTAPSVALANTAVTAASYTYASITVDAQGRITAASNGATPLTSGGALGTPSSGTLTNCGSLPVSGITASTSTALGVGSIELGHATDTTLARSAAGVITIEGVEVVTLSRSQTLTNKTLTSPTLTTPILGTPTSGNLSNCTADGTNGVGFRSIPSAGAEKTGSYTLATSDRAEFVQVGSGGSITVPNSTFAAGDVVVIYNNHTAAITITLSTTNAYIAGTNTNKTSVSLATRGVCNILFVSATVAILTGNIT